MTLEFEKLTEHVERMAQGAAQRREQENVLLEALLEKLQQKRSAWEEIEEAVERATQAVDMKWYRGARPVTHEEPLDTPVRPPVAPERATLVACDGSQIVPDRHAAFLYSVVNVGSIVYHHGRGRAPAQDTHPTLDFPGNGEDEDTFVEKAAIVNLRRDLAEIETLVETAQPHCAGPDPVLALLDQRLLYWPVGSAGDDEGQRVLWGWQRAMSDAADSGCLLAGYIDRPGKRSVLTLLRTLDIKKEGFDPQTLVRHDYGPRFDDVTLFRHILTEPGERSAVFADVSQHNEEFKGRDPANEVCFFYLNPGGPRWQIARVDIPRWIAEEREKVEAVHGLIYDQCQIMGDYPYVLARADEMAVISFQDRENLDIIIENAMQRYDVGGTVTAKQSSKDVARAGRTRHEM